VQPTMNPRIQSTQVEIPSHIEYVAESFFCGTGIIGCW